jgi:uncharacterized protein (DUF779 family)
MKIEATDKALDVIRAMKQRRHGKLVITLGTGCCESTAPFLYEDFDPGADSEAVGEVGGVTVYAPKWLADLYSDDTLVLDADLDVVTESFSIETEIDARLKLAIPEGTSESLARSS